MKIVKIEILPANAGEVVTGTITVEGEGGYSNTVESGTPQAAQTLSLSDDQKVVIEGKVQDQIELDKEQMAAKKAPLGEKAEEQAKKDEEQTKKLEKINKEEEERLEKEMPEEAKLRKAQEKARDEKIMGKSPEGKPVEGDPNFKFPPPPLPGQRDAGLRHETPADSKTVKEEASTTKAKK